MLYYNYIYRKEPQKSIGNYLGPYSKSLQTMTKKSIWSVRIAEGGATPNTVAPFRVGVSEIRGPNIDPKLVF